MNENMNFTSLLDFEGSVVNLIFPFPHLVKTHTFGSTVFKHKLECDMECDRDLAILGH